MKDAKLKILASLLVAITEHPELRIGQMLTNAAKCEEWKDNDIFYIPDETLLSGLEKFLEDFNYAAKN